MDSFFKMVDVQTVLFIYMAVGFGCRKAGIFNDVARDKLTDFVVFVALPCMIFESFNMAFSLESLKQGALALLIAVGMSCVALLLGNHGGVLGETCAITLLLGGIYLIATKVISPVIPVTYLATVAVLSAVSGHDPIVQLLSGGLMLGAFFMATDYVTSPTTNKGKLVFGIGLGIITCAIRFLGTMNEGVSFAILLMNLLVPYIEILTRQDRLGIAKAKAKKEGAAK